MTYGDIHVYVDSSDAGMARVRLAAGIARYSAAHVTGYFIKLALKPLTDVEVFDEAGVQSQAYRDELKLLTECREQDLFRAEGMFRSYMKDVGIDSTWTVLSDDLQDSLPTEGRYADLVILGNDSFGEEKAGPLFAGRLALESGRPVLRVPEEAKVDDFGTRILVAWNGSRDAARALADAQPFLARAAFVSVLAVIDPWQDVQPAMDELEKVVVHLRHLGVSAQRYVVQASSLDISREILAHARQTECDLIVMGAYGHSPIGEAILGGVTRNILKEAHTPLLLSH